MTGKAARSAASSARPSPSTECRHACRARITADSRYCCSSTGRRSYRGPIRSQPRRLTYDLFDLAPYLKPGENTIAVFVVYYGKPRSFWMPAARAARWDGHGVLVFEAELWSFGWSSKTAG